MAKPKKRAHQITHAQRYLPRNRKPDAITQAIDNLREHHVAAVTLPTHMELVAAAAERARPKLMTPAELTLKRRKELRPKVTVIK